jgi:RimJ/RimL family protein N-acetyltransferase
MDALLKWCKDRNISEIRLDVYEDNPSAIRAYEKVGLKKHLITMRMNLDD